MLFEIPFDARDLEAPLPMQEVLRMLPDLDEKSYIKMIHRQEPSLLFGMLKKRACKVESKQIESELWYIYIYKEHALKAQEAIQKLL